MSQVMPKVAVATKRILMCRPTYFQLNYSINPWMDMKRGVNKEKAVQQWNKLKATIEEAGAAVEVVEPVGAENFPDMVFTANAAIIRGNRAYLANFFHAERKGERYFFERWFSDNGFECVGSLEIPSEGAGDALWVGPAGRRLYMGVGPRTDARALDDVAEKLDDGTHFKVLGCRLIDPRFYHIDVALCPLNEEVGIWYPYAFDSITQHNMRNDLELMPVSEKEARNFACNTVVVGSTVIMNEAALNDGLAKRIEKLGFNTVGVDMSEFIKSGGSAKCCTLALNP